ncbi:MAG TPA: DNA-directed RNA polymerase subunit omega [Candidatus Omnitrophota bacterium]|nr:DNA-directed RNA polymerase subunit omega [Candidatus Omnitrophota bacterium]HPD84582.1 DNA-directed RNA polymerase subunit omega [Candidatus Omnitrophota bacterium]HRZ03440.1 DNA-directed RNA polymerase subunit omega [Candidatus Omnitrophota bacterium]
MGYQPLGTLLPRAGWSIYKLVLLAAKRATEIADGQPPLIDLFLGHNKKATTIALDEVAAGKVELKEVAEAREAQEKAKGKKKEKE